MPIEDADIGEDISSGNDGSDSDSDKSSDLSVSGESEKDLEDGSSESESAAKPAGSRELPPEYYATMPDNQLGMKDHNEFWGVSDCEGKESPTTPEVDPTPEENKDEIEEPQSPQDKMKAYWKKFVVPWPRPKESQDEAVSDSGSDSDHLSSETLQLLPHSSPDPSEKSDNDGTGSDVSFCSSVASVREFEEAMGQGAKESHQSALSRSSSLSTLQTPRCSKPDT